MIKTFVKDPAATLDYTLDWSRWLDTDTIASSQFTATPNTITIANQTNTTTDCTVWLSGGQMGTEYTITNTITTAAGRIDERSFTVRIQNR